MKYKTRYGSRIQINPVNSIRGKLSIQLDKGARLEIGKFLMVTGPLYIKGTKIAQSELATIVFLS